MQEYELQTCCSKLRQTSGAAYHRTEDRLACWTVGWLLVQAHRHLQRPYSPEQEKRRPSGQTWIESSDLHLSVSHSGPYVAIVLGNRPVGIDVEVWTTKPDMNMAADFLSTDERQFCHRQSPEIQTLFLQQSWLYKEAYLKMQGLALQVQPTQISSLQPRPEIQIWQTQWDQRADVTVMTVHTASAQQAIQ